FGATCTLRLHSYCTGTGGTKPRCVRDQCEYATCMHRAPKPSRRLFPAVVPPAPLNVAFAEPAFAVDVRMDGQHSLFGEASQGSIYYTDTFCCKFGVVERIGFGVIGHVVELPDG